MPFASASSQTRSNASPSLSASRARISSRVQNRRPRSCTHSKYDTVTPPAFVRTSGQDRGCRARRGSRRPRSTSGRSRPRRRASCSSRGAFSAVIWSSSAASTSRSHGSSSSSALVTCCASGYPSSDPWSAIHACSAVEVEPVGRVDAAGDVGDGEHGRALRDELLRGDAADVAEALHDARLLRQVPAEPLASALDDASRRRAPVASCRKSEPPSAIGLPVTISGTA